MQKATDEQILSAYHATGSVWRTGNMLRMAGQTVHERLRRMGYHGPGWHWTKEEDQALRDWYNPTIAMGDMLDMARGLKRSYASVANRLNQLGVSTGGAKRRKGYPVANKDKGPWKEITEREALKILNQFRASRWGTIRFCQSKGYGFHRFVATLKRFFPSEYDAIVDSKRRPRSTMYQRGRAFEWKVRDHLRGLGYFVLRSPRSAGPLDLVALKAGQTPLLIQAKLGSAGLTRKARLELIDLARTTGTIPILARGQLGRLHYRRLDIQDLNWQP